MQERQRIAARRSELDALAEELAKQLQEVRVERDELAVAERVLNRLAGQVRADAEAVAPVSVQAAGLGAIADLGFVGLDARPPAPGRAVSPALSCRGLPWPAVRTAAGPRRSGRSRTR